MKLFTSIIECSRSPQGECDFHRRTIINKIIFFLIGIELYFTFIFALAGPFVSVFIVKGISGGTASVVGVAAMIFLLTKSLLQVPFSRLVDQASQENKIVGILSVGHLVIALCPLVLAFGTEPWHVYLANFFCGLGNALAYPSFNALFTHHMDKKQAAFDWSIYDTVLGLGAAGAAAAGGFLIDRTGFQTVFLGVGVIILLSSFLPMIFYRRFVNTHEHI